jgi:hypothetical protein
MAAALRASRAPQHALFALLPVAASLWLLSVASAHGILAVDFRDDFWVAGSRVLHGNDPYLWSRAQVAAGISFPYPPLTAVLFAPLALLAPGQAAVLFTLLSIAAGIGLLGAVSVRDWRLYGLVLLLSPVVTAWQTGNLTLVLALGVALVWRWRDRPMPAGLLLALLVCVKPIALPLGLWLLASRRFAATAWAAGTVVALSLGVWALVGLREITSWLHLLAVQGDLLYRKGYGVIALVADAGLGRAAGTATAAAATCVLGLACVGAARRRRDLAAFAIAVAMMITISPQVDQHYFVLLLVPLAIAHPRLEPIWALPLVLWACPSDYPQLWQVVLFWVVVAAVTLDCTRSGQAQEATAARAQGAVSARALEGLVT